MKKGIRNIKTSDEFPEEACQPLYKKVLMPLFKLTMIFIVCAGLLIISVMYNNNKAANLSRERNSPIGQMHQTQEGLSQVRNDRKDNIDFLSLNRRRISEVVRMGREMGFNISELDFGRHGDPERLMEEIESEYEIYLKDHSDHRNKHQSLKEDVNAHQVNWLKYSDVENNFSLLMPDETHCNVRKDDFNDLIVELYHYNASMFISFVSLEESLSNSREDYLEMFLSAGDSHVEEELAIRGADQAYLINQRSSEHRAKTVIAFKDNHVFSMGYSIFGNDQENQEAINGVEQYFDHMRDSITIE